MAITKTNKLNMTGGSVPLVIHLSQYDDDFTLIFELYSTDGTFTISSGTTAEVRGTKSDGRGFSANATLDITNKRVTVTGDQQMTAAAGRNIFELTLWKNDKELNTANFILDVEPAALDRNTITSESKILELLDVTDRADEIIDAADQVVNAIDSTLTQAGRAADAKKTGDEISALRDEVSNVAFSQTARDALLNCFAHVAWIDEHGQDYYDALEEALAINSLVGIEATFTQGSRVYSSTDELDDLKACLVVVAEYEDESTKTVTDYELIGNLSESQSVITVLYREKTTTFTVSVSTLPTGYTQKNYVLANGTQEIATSIPETNLQNCWIRHKERRTGNEDRAGHIFSSYSFFTPFIFIYGTDTSTKRLNANRFGTQIFSSERYAWEVDADYIIEAYKNGDGVYVNGTHVTDISVGSTTPSSNNPMYLLAYPGGNATFRHRGRLYYLKVFNSNNEKVYDFMPCTNSNNVVGLYDLVNRVFYAPTIGTLVAG